jgi:quinoprotein glucose dehydrogenase
LHWYDADVLVRVALFFATVLCLAADTETVRKQPSTGYTGWPANGGGPDSIRYSRLQQINRSNVAKLQVAWTYETGDSEQGTEMQCNPVLAHGVLYVTSPTLRVIALDAATGKEIWTFNPHEGKPERGRNRGVTYWESGRDRRIFFVQRQWLFALDARTGKPVRGFGIKGRVDLREGLGRDPKKLTVTATTPGLIHKDLLIMGSLVSEGLPSAPGDIRAYDVRTGKIRWTFHTLPRPGEFGYETWPKEAWTYAGGTNNWAGMALDAKRGIVFAPTGSASFDFYGANRHGDNLFANCLLALNADTGERIWHFQFIKHDVWDRDFPAPPSLITVKRDGRLVDAVSQATKSGHVLVFERETGKQLFPIEFKSVPASDVDGELLATTQAHPLRPEPFARQQLTEETLSNRTPEINKLLRERFRTLRSGPQYTPPSREGTIVFPGFDGAAEWGGQAFDPETGFYYVNSNEMAWVLRLVPRPAETGRQSAKVLYTRNCAACHREDMGGSPPEFPSLKAISERMKADKLKEITLQGRGRMPGFQHLPATQVDALVRFLASGEDVATASAQGASPIEQKYQTDGYNKFLDPDGYPGIAPPWGTLNAINLDTGEYAWKIPFGEFPELAAKGFGNTGTENYGGPVVTAGGLLFIGATNHDRKFRAYDKLNGKLLWETELPAAGNATPAVYEVNGKQFVVIAAGGGKSGAPSGGKYVAFALP